jgi:hypothetical protein
MPLRVVNITPNVLSNDTQGDTEPSIAVDGANPQRIAITAFTPDPAASGSAPIYVSVDGGLNWATNVCLPGGNTTGDSSVRFAGQAGMLYAGILRIDTGNMAILRSTFPPAGIMTQLINRAGPDQPWVTASWAGVPGGTAERVYVTSNDGGQAAVQFSLDAATAAAPAGFGAAVNLQLRTGSSRPSVRGAIHRSGRIYITFVRATAGGSDIVVMRDDVWGNNGFADLVDAGDGIAGVRVVSGVTVPPVGTLLGTQRVSSRIAIAVDPRNRRRVYLAWCDGAVTAMSPFTLHVRRSDDGGVNWTGDLRTIVNVTNPCLAVNVQGVAALMYQQLVTVAGANRWNTVLERSTDRFATVATTSVLANTPPGVGFGAAGDLGDFCNLIAHAKDFYGTFCAVNAPLNANFPSGVTFLRNADFTTGNLRNVANTANVAASVDPFFVHWQTVEPKDDVFVRDWTDSAAVADDGAEPSLRPAFYVTPDVWNRRATDPGPFVSDRPSNENAGNGVGNIGNNWMFARIRRRAAAPAGSPDLAVTAHFLVSPLGTGSNYLDASSMDPDVTFPDPDPVVTFAAADVGPITTPAFQWHLNPVGSSHLCAAVEISAPGDPFVGASLRGRAPGWPDTDLEIVDDNNKAQRNMGLSTTPARESGGESILWALVHNAAVWRRDLELRIRWPIPRDIQGRPSAAVVRPGADPVPIRGDARVVLRRMEPLENRWIGVRLRGIAGKRWAVTAVEFDEMVEGAVVSGFALGVQIGSDREVAAHAAERVRSVATRLVYGWGADLGDALETLSAGRPLRFPDVVALAGKIAELSLGRGRNQFGIETAFGAFRRVAGKATLARLVALTSLMETIDAHLTSLRLARGTRADILQTVRWKLAVVDDASRAADRAALARIAARCRQFVDDWEARRAQPADAVDLVRATLEPMGTLGSPSTRRELFRLGEACLAAGQDLDLFQGRYAALVRALATALEPRRRR